MYDKVEKENQANFSSFNFQIPCITQYTFKKQSQDAYTTANFKEFQRELAAKMYYELSYDKGNVSISDFIVNEDVIAEGNHHHVSFIVCISEAISEAKCSC